MKVVVLASFRPTSNEGRVSVCPYFFLLFMNHDITHNDCWIVIIAVNLPRPVSPIFCLISEQAHCFPLQNSLFLIVILWSCNIYGIFCCQKSMWLRVNWCTDLPGTPFISEFHGTYRIWCNSFCLAPLFGIHPWWDNVLWFFTSLCRNLHYLSHLGINRVQLLLLWIKACSSCARRI